MPLSFRWLVCYYLFCINGNSFIKIYILYLWISIFLLVLVVGVSLFSLPLHFHRIPWYLLLPLNCLCCIELCSVIANICKSFRFASPRTLLIHSLMKLSMPIMALSSFFPGKWYVTANNSFKWIFFPFHKWDWKKNFAILIWKEIVLKVYMKWNEKCSLLYFGGWGRRYYKMIIFFQRPNNHKFYG